MKCKKCGQELGVGSKFCGNCGYPVTEGEHPSEKNKKKKFWIAGGCVLLLLCVVFLCVYQGNNSEKRYQTLIDDGNKYIEEMDYQKAEDNFNKAIKIKPKEDEGYIGLSTVYLKENDYEKANKILEQAPEKVKAESKEIKKQIEKVESEKKESDEMLFPIPIEGKWGYAKKDGTMVIEPQYYHASSFDKHGLARVRTKDRDGNYHVGCINKEGKWIVENKYIYIEPFSEDGYSTVIAESGGDAEKYGVIDKTGKIIIEPEYDQIWYVRQGILGAASGEDADGDLMWGLLDVNGNKLTPFEYYRIWPPDADGICLAEKNIGDAGYKYGYINKNGEQILPFEYDFANRFDDNGISCVAKEDESGNMKYGYIDINGTVVIDFKYDSGKNFSENGLACVSKVDGAGKEQFGYINKDEEIIIPYQFDNAYSFQKNGLARVEREIEEDKYEMGYIDKEGKMVVDFQKVLGNVNENGLIYTEDPKKNRCGFSDKSGQIIVPRKYTTINDMSEKELFTGFWGDDNTGESGQEIRDWNGFDWEEVYSFDIDDSMAKVALFDEEGVKWGYVSSGGIEIVPPVYDECLKIGDLIKVETRVGNKVSVGYLNHNGQEVFGFDPINWYELSDDELESVVWDQTRAREGGVLEEGYYAGYTDDMSASASIFTNDRGYVFLTLTYRVKSDDIDDTAKFKWNEEKDIFELIESRENIECELSGERSEDILNLNLKLPEAEKELKFVLNKQRYMNAANTILAVKDYLDSANCVLDEKEELVLPVTDQDVSWYSEMMIIPIYDNKISKVDYYDKTINKNSILYYVAVAGSEFEDPGEAEIYKAEDMDKIFNNTATFSDCFPEDMFDVNDCFDFE